MNATAPAFVPSATRSTSIGAGGSVGDSAKARGELNLSGSSKRGGGAGRGSRGGNGGARGRGRGGARGGGRGGAVAHDAAVTSTANNNQSVRSPSQVNQQQRQQRNSPAANARGGSAQFKSNFRSNGNNTRAAKLNVTLDESLSTVEDEYVLASLAERRIAERAPPAGDSEARESWARRRRQQRQASPQEFYRPEVYVQANFKLLVEANVDVARSDEAGDSDYVPWSSVVQAFVATETPYVCPICMEPPSPARITRCGHTFCLGCLAHWFEASSQTLISCPLCYEHLRDNGLRPAVVLPPAQPVVADDVIEFTLVRRAVHSSVCVPRGLCAAVKPAATMTFPVVDCSSHALPSQLFARCAVPTRNTIDAIIGRERRDLARLTAAAVSAGDEDLANRLQRATTLIDSFAKRVVALSWPTQADAWITSTPTPSIAVSSTADAKRNNNDDGEDASHDTTAAAAADDVEAAFSDDDNTSSPRASSEQVTPSKQAQSQQRTYDEDEYWFYQASDGRALFLHPLCHRALLLDRGGNAALLPAHIKARVVENEQRQMDQRQRSKLHELAHLPPAQTFGLIEIELSPLVSPVTMSAMASELAGRRQRRVAFDDRRRRDEQRAKARADAHAESVARARERRVAGRPGEDAAITSVGAYAPPDLTAFEALPTAAPGTSPSSSTLSPEATAAWRRLNERRAAQSAATRDHGPAPAPAAAAATLDDDDEARYAPPPRLTFDLSDMLVVKPARSRKR